MSKPVRIDIACNDPDNGLFAGRAEQIQFDDCEFEARRRRPPKFEEGIGWIRLAGRTWPIVASKEWYGNWCWNAYWMQPGTAVDFLVWLHRRGFYDLTCGDEALFGAWEDPKSDRIASIVLDMIRAVEAV